MMEAAATLLFALWWLFGLGVVPVLLHFAGVSIPYTEPADLDVWFTAGVFF